MSIFGTILAAAATFIVGVISAMGYWGVALLMAIESACIPLPSEIIMPFAGYLVSIGELNLLGVATAGAIGCNLGSIPAYALGQYGGRPAVERYGRYVLMSADDLDRAERFFARFGGLAVLIGRLLPVVRTFIAVPAGVARMNQWRFHIYTFVGSWPWCFALAWVGMKMGENWRDNPALSNILHRLDFVIVGVGVAAVVWFVWHRLKHRPKV
jgi:membrane protein DedA with SNARE-associated domain